jgi:hypothetical protein
MIFYMIMELYLKIELNDFNDFDNFYDFDEYRYDSYIKYLFWVEKYNEIDLNA